jgi:hypothetical protein
MKRIAGVPQLARDADRLSPGSRQDVPKLCPAVSIGTRPQPRRASSHLLSRSKSRAEKGTPA